MADKSKDEWKAYIDTMPGGPQTLHVKGTVDVGNLHDGLTIERDGLEKSNPPILVLKLVPAEILVPRGPGDTKVKLHYKEAANVGQYAGIAVTYPDGSQVEIDLIGIVT
jgi:hypothetical protein